MNLKKQLDQLLCKNDLLNSAVRDKISKVRCDRGCSTASSIDFDSGKMYCPSCEKAGGSKIHIGIVTLDFRERLIALVDQTQSEHNYQTLAATFKQFEQRVQACFQNATRSLLSTFESNFQKIMVSLRKSINIKQDLLNKSVNSLTVVELARSHCFLKDLDVNVFREGQQSSFQEQHRNLKISLGIVSRSLNQLVLDPTNKSVHRIQTKEAFEEGLLLEKLPAFHRVELGWPVTSVTAGRKPTSFYAGGVGVLMEFDFKTKTANNISNRFNISAFARDPLGQIHFCCDLNKTFFMLGSQNEVERTLPKQLLEGNCFAFQVDEEQTYYYADIVHSKIIAVRGRPEDKFEKAIVLDYVQSGGLVRVNPSTLLFSDLKSGVLGLVGTEGRQQIQKVDGVALNFPNSIVQISQNHFICAELHSSTRLLSIRLEGPGKKLKPFWVHGKGKFELHNPHQMCMDAEGGLLVAEFEGQSVVRLSRELLKELMLGR